MNTTYLSFRGDIYLQTFGTATGLLVVANLEMEDVEEHALPTFDSELFIDVNLVG